VVIELTRVTKLYRTVIGVNDISLSLEPGAHGLLGPNGAGKSTFINLVTGQLKPTRGKVRVFGLNPWNRSDVLRRIGVCPGDEALYSNVSGWDWVRYLVELHGYRRSEAAKRASSALERLGMTSAMHRPIGTYSRGMRQRTKLAQAIAHEPELLILDEPFSGLDPIGRHLVMELLLEHTQRGGSLVLASHVLHEVEAVSPAFLLICGGRLLASGTSQEIAQLMADLPSDIEIVCDRPHELAHCLLREEAVRAVGFRGSARLVVSTSRPLTIYQALPHWAAELGVRIDEVHSPDDSLQTLFDSLLRVHRGGS
jgi:ABC-2 type transport system ATP-binding protein